MRQRGATLMAPGQGRRSRSWRHAGGSCEGRCARGLVVGRLAVLATLAAGAAVALVDALALAAAAQDEYDARRLLGRRSVADQPADLHVARIAVARRRRCIISRDRI